MAVDQDALRYFNLIGQLQKTIQKAEKLEEAITDSVMLFKKYLDSDYAIVWYAEADQKTLHPYYFVGDRDLTFATHEVGSGVVGRVYQNETAERMLQYTKGMDPETDRDFSEDRVKSMICVPFSVGDEARGVLQFIRINGSEVFTEESADVCEIMVHLIGMEIKENEKLCAPWRFHEVMMSAQNIQKTYQNGEERTVVLRGVNMDVYEGEFVVILGESGSGKSTFMNIIGGMDKADEGAFQFLGEEMSGKTQDELTDFRRDHIGFIFQNYNLISSLTAAQNIDLIGELVEDHLTSDEVLRMVGLSDKKNNYPSQLSGGQQQRVSIARALVKKPKLIFADEPTSALDFATSIEILTVLENVVKSGTTLVMVTHNEEITRMADRVVRMRGGKTFDITLNRNPVHASELVW